MSDKLAEALSAVSKGTADTLLVTGMNAIQAMKAREQKLGDLTVHIATIASRRMHNNTPEEIASFVEQCFREAGFNISVKPVEIA